MYKIDFYRLYIRIVFYFTIYKVNILFLISSEAATFQSSALILFHYCLPFAYTDQ